MSQLSETTLRVLPDVLRMVRHDAAPYEGDGDPGCYSRCPACKLEGLLDLARKATDGKDG